MFRIFPKRAADILPPPPLLSFPAPFFQPQLLNSLFCHWRLSLVTIQTTATAPTRLFLSSPSRIAVSHPRQAQSPRGMHEAPCAQVVRCASSTADAGQATDTRKTNQEKQKPPNRMPQPARRHPSEKPNGAGMTQGRSLSQSWDCTAPGKDPARA